MHRKSAASVSGSALIESLEERTLFSNGIGVITPAAARTPTTSVSIRASRHSTVLGQPLIVEARVKASKHAGTIAGTVEILDDGTPIAASPTQGTPLMLTLQTKDVAGYAFGTGNIALFTGKHTLTAEFVSSNTLPGSTSKAYGETVKLPRYKVASDGLKTATIVHGRGKAIAASNTATVTYTGFLASTGQIFDYATSPDHGSGASSSFSFTVEATPTEQVISGFDQGVVGMKAGETRVIDIPAALGYGSQGATSSSGATVVPPNTDLVFFVTLLSIK